MIFGKADEPLEQYLKPMERAFEVLDMYLEDGSFVAGDNITIADYSIVVSVCTAKVWYIWF